MRKKKKNPAGKKRLVRKQPTKNQSPKKSSMKAGKFDIGIHCGTVLTMAEGKAKPQTDIFIGVRGRKIAAVEKWKLSHRKACKKWVDHSGKVVLPGLVNGHVHLAMSLLRGLQDDVPLKEWLFETIFPLEAALVDRDFVKLGTELAALETIRFGVTTVNDMYFYAETVAEVLSKAGLRAIVSQTAASFPLPEDKVLGADKEKLFRSARKKFEGHPRIEIGIAPHAPYTCSDELLKKTVQWATETGAPLHIHVSETQGEVEDSKKEFGKTPVERLRDLGVLRKGTICAHCVHLDEKDTEILRKSGASVVYNPDSNLKLGSGIAPIPQYLKRGIPVSIGTDGTASNNDLSIFGAMDLGTKIQKVANRDNTAMVAEQALVMATYGGAIALGLQDTVGSIEIGKAADIIALDFEKPHLQPVFNVVSHLVYSAQGPEVCWVMCDGDTLFEGGKYRTLNEKKIFAEVKKMRFEILKQVDLLKSKKG